MKIYRFNTNIKCAACQQKIAQTFNPERRIVSFKVNLQDAKRPLEVSTADNMTETEVLALIKQAGYEAKAAGGLSKSWLGSMK